ncbi:hypothetical protein B0H13DRAFT_2464046 [Mycena leptocephala]|nr:hypothetical protein B0H13DRAFT_2464046 [Mycena leptocephala]
MDDNMQANEDEDALSKPKRKIPLFDHSNDERTVLTFDEGQMPQRFVDFAHALCATEHGSRAIELRQLRAVVEDHLGQDVQNIYDRAVEALRALKPIDGAAWEKAKAEAEAERDESYRLRRARLDARVAAARAEWVRHQPVVDLVLRGGIRIRPIKGLRETHAVPLTAEDFYLDDARPTELPSVLMGHTCTICLNAKSHPVS